MISQNINSAHNSGPTPTNCTMNRFTFHKELQLVSCQLTVISVVAGKDYLILTILSGSTNITEAAEPSCGSFRHGINALLNSSVLILVYLYNGSWIGAVSVARLSTPVQIGPGAHPAPYTMGTGSFPGGKRPGRGIGHPPPSSAKVEGRVELHIYSPLQAFVACFRENFIPLQNDI